jgi:Na+/phosphate symporter
MLFALPREVLLGFMRGGPGTMMPLTLGILTGVGAIVVLALCLSPLAKPRLAGHAMELIAGTMILMVITRHQIRGVYLAMENRGASVAVAPPWGVISLFLLCFLGAGLLTGMVLKRAVRDRPGPGEDTA